nr:MAG TPA: Single-strand DNA-binding protein [Caudoviricetes sp.]DAG40321.1 MAG TPA: Single-strand DNA-binding protein [Caudoviricetes sp.]DAT83377.1 MAG TPA: Single-strand DNA-binding protein [Caudoviricetes sp.]
MVSTLPYSVSGFGVLNTNNTNDTNFVFRCPTNYTLNIKH